MTLQALQHDIPKERVGNERRFHVAIAGALLFTALAGFAPTYFLKAVTHAPALSLLTHVHGAVFTAWLVLLLVQSGLVAGRRVAWHRRLGVFGGGFSLELAQDVAADAQIDRWAVLDLLGHLVDKSLVIADGNDRPRYRLLASVRAFALE